MMNCEMSSRKILPAIRKELVVTLVKMGKKQNEVAKMLQVTPAAVTQYLKGKRAKIKLDGNEKAEAVKIAKKGLKRGAIAEKDICHLCEEMQLRLSGRAK